MARSRSNAPPVSFMVGRPDGRLTTPRSRQNTPPRNPKELNPKLDDDVAGLLLKGIAKDPAARFMSAREFKEALLKLKRQDY